MNSGFRFFSYFARNQKLKGVAVASTGSLLCTAVLAKSQGMTDLSLDTKPSVILPDVMIAREVKSPVDKTGLNLRLYQYQTCPFCTKVRAALDFYGFSYEVVEVNPVTRKQIKFSSYRKVPILISQGNDNEQLNDSTLIISILASYVADPSQNLQQLKDNYPVAKIQNPKKKPGKMMDDVQNKYFLMMDGANDETIDRLSHERQWREWADKELVHMLSPNVYRTWDEALEAFNWFSKIGEWERLFSDRERQMVIYVGAAAMYLIGKRLKKRHHLKPDVRESLYDSCRKWMIAIGKDKPFMGGSEPNLSDLAVYGVLKSIEGCRAFKDLLENVKIGAWFKRMDDATKNHLGSKQLQLAVSKLPQG